jgi:signal transduction histidine kinase
MGNLSGWTLAVPMAIVVALAVTSVFIPAARFAVNAPIGQPGVEAASTCARLFAALVLWLFPNTREQDRLRWIAGGLLIYGSGGLAFGFAPALLGHRLPLDVSMYESLVVWTFGAALFAVGLVPRNVPACTQRAMVSVLGAYVGCCVFVLVGHDHLPLLARFTDPTRLTDDDAVTVPGLTPWHYVVSVIPLALNVLATVAVVRNVRRGLLGGWLVLAMVWLADAQAQNLLMPTTYTSVISSADIFRFAFGAAAAIGATYELRRVAAERQRLLEVEQEHVRRLADIGVLRANFTAMAAHELQGPLSAIRGYLAMLRTGDLSAEEQSRVFAAVQKETQMLGSLAGDVQSASVVERDDFAVELRPVPISVLLLDAQAFVAALPGEHTLQRRGATNMAVWADEGRILQVIRNLLSNAAKFSPDGAPIELEVERAGANVRIAIVDHGRGIQPEDMHRIFERFGRGRATGEHVAGIGLGLYLSRRIVQAHGSNLQVESEPGAGSTFWFELEAAE